MESQLLSLIKQFIIAVIVMTISRRYFFSRLGTVALAPSVFPDVSSDPMVGYDRFDFVQQDISRPVYKKAMARGFFSCMSYVG